MVTDYVGSQKLLIHHLSPSGRLAFNDITNVSRVNDECEMIVENKICNAKKEDITIFKNNEKTVVRNYTPDYDLFEQVLRETHGCELYSCLSLDDI